MSLQKACCGVLQFIMDSGSRAAKLQEQKASKSIKFLMIHSGDPVNYSVDTAMRSSDRCARHQSEGHTALGPT